MKLKYILLITACLTIIASGCGSKNQETVVPTNTPSPTKAITVMPVATPTVEGQPAATLTPAEAITPTETPEPTATSTPTPLPEPTATSTPTPLPEPTATNVPTPLPTEVPSLEQFLIVIDPGHQRKGNYEKEPNGPGSEEMKAKVSSGTQGVSTDIPEYVLTLEVSLLLREELQTRGYEVVMTRETHDIDISNVERALIANELQADAFIRVHADGADSASAEGVTTLCQTPENPYNSEWYEESRRLSELVLEEVVEETGAKKRRVWETDTMTGINWTTVPTTILEMGFMSNPREDELMATEEYRLKIVKGVADAIDRFLEEE